MMDKTFRTAFSISKPAFSIGYEDSVLLLGSCFSDNIGAILHQSKFDTSFNPFGIQFNPASLVTLLQWATNKNEVTS